MFIINFLVAVVLVFAGFMFSRFMVFHELNYWIKNRKESTEICLKLVDKYSEEFDSTSDDQRRHDLLDKIHENNVNAKECLEHYKALCIFKEKIDLL